MKRAVPWLAGFLFLGCLALGFFLLRQKAEIKQDVAARAAAEKDAQVRIAGLQLQLSALKAAKAEADEQNVQLAQGALGLAKTKGENAESGSRLVHISDIIKEHPEYEALYERQIRRNVDRMYGNGLSTLNLAPSQLSQLKNLLTERQMVGVDAQQAAEAAGLQPGSPAWQTAMAQAGGDVEQQISSILGSNADAILAQLQAKANIQMQVQNTYGPDFSDAGLALTAEQSGGLVQAMADANFSGKDTSTRPANYNIADPTTWLSPHDDRIINSATQVLSAAQIQLLTTDQMQNEQMSAIMKQYNSGSGRVIFVP